MQPRPMRRRASLGRALALALVATLVLSVAPATAGEWPEAVPAEPGAVVLPPALTLQAFVGDLDADGRRELLRLSRDSTSATLLEAWRLGDDGWAPAGPPVEVLAGHVRGREQQAVYAEAPARLLAWHDGERERVMLVTQPRFEELDVGPACCMVLNDVQLVDGQLRLVDLGGRTFSVDAVLPLDLDGDGRDELLATRSLTPLGDISFPIEAHLLRFDGVRFGRPETVELPFGSGDSPFLLGETDGRPGEEAGVLGRLGPPTLFRIRLDGDELVMEGAPFARGASAAVAVTAEEGPAVAVLVNGHVSIARWPAGSESEVLAVSRAEGELVGVAETAAGPLLVLDRGDDARAAVLATDLRPIAESGGTIVPSRASALLAARRLGPYAGQLPGGGIDGSAALVYGGRLVGGGFDASEEPYEIGVPIAAFAAALPVGLAGEGGWLAILHATPLLENPGRDGGRLESLGPLPGARLSLAPLDVVLGDAEGDGTFTPPLDCVAMAADRLLVGESGICVELDAPPGSKAVPIGLDATVEGQQLSELVPESGRLRLELLPAAGDSAALVAGLAVLTPAGHTYVAAWQAEVLRGPPPLSAEASTPLGSPDVVVSGRVARPAELTVDGRPVPVAEDGSFEARVPAPPWPTQVELEAVDVVGNRATNTVSVVGLLDYRRLPWVPIVVVSTAAAAILLFVRTPRLRGASERRDGDAVLEELEGDEQTG